MDPGGLIHFCALQQPGANFLQWSWYWKLLWPENGAHSLAVGFNHRSEGSFLWTEQLKFQFSITILSLWGITQTSNGVLLRVLEIYSTARSLQSHLPGKYDRQTGLLFLIVVLVWCCWGIVWWGILMMAISAHVFLVLCTSATAWL